MKTITFMGLVGSLMIISCSESSTKESTSKSPTFTISPPIDSLAPEGETFTVNTTKDTILVTATGTFIHVPEQSFVDKEGNPATTVELNFKEYSDPADIYLSGIPMDYIEGTDTLNFQSSGMCEITARTDGQELNIAENKSLDIGMRHREKGCDYNLYYFDKQLGEWVEKEKNLEPDTTSMPIPVTDPSTIDSNRIVDVMVENAFRRKRYAVWHESQFELVKGQETKYQDKDLFWYHIGVTPSPTEGIFVLDFQGARWGNQYREKLLVKPITKEGSYDEAIALFQKKIRQQAKIVLENNRRIRELEKTNREITERMEEEIQSDRINDSIATVEANKNQLVRWRSDSIAIVEATKQEMQRWKMDSTERENYQKNLVAKRQVTRVFSISQTGIYNCDRFYREPIAAERTITLYFNDKPAKISNPALCNIDQNTVLRGNTFQSNTLTQYHARLANHKYFLIGVAEGKILVIYLHPDKLIDEYEMQEMSAEELKELIGWSV